MDKERFDRQLRLLVLLTQDRDTDIDSLSRELQMSRRSIYRYIETFRELGFVVEKRGNRYRVAPSSPFFRRITERIHFTEDEALTINQVLNAVYDRSPQVRHLRQKLSSLYDFDVLARHGVDEHIARNLAALYDAVKLERVAVLRGYVSPSSGKVSDRMVEPYMFLSENSEVRCYELATGMNKTFKISRAERVDLLDMLWSHKEAHLPFYTDMFGFSGEQLFPVRLVLGPLSARLLIEEVPSAASQLALLDDGRYRLHARVCSYKGVGRFVLGLCDDVEVESPRDFKDYLRARVRFLTQKIGA
ncbi:MAG TPA: WYL domain-containing transcriptional regulator [Candidatus Caccomonas pullistercoris]|nr:WYL domain-containing transcriptional regulator [Candidatus Caccomonas pullistercoris]